MNEHKEKYRNTDLITEAVHMHQCVQFFMPLFCPQHKILHIGFTSANQCLKNICCRAGVTGANKLLCLCH